MRQLLWLTLSLLCIFGSGVHAQPPDTLWTRVLGGPSDQAIAAVQETTDGGLMLAGVYSSAPGEDFNFLLIKTDSNGQIQWQQNYGGESDDALRDGIVTSDGGFALTGYTDSFGSVTRDLYVLKLNATGDSLWATIAGSFGIDIGYSIHETDDGGFIATGSSNQGPAIDVYVVRLDALGNTLWTRVYDRGIPGGRDAGRYIIAVADGWVIVGASSDPPEFPNPRKYDLYVMFIGSAGDTLWTRRYGSEPLDEFGLGGTVGQDGSLYVCGYVDRISQPDQGLILHFGSDGSLLADHIYESDTLSLVFQDIRTSGPWSLVCFGQAAGQNENLWLMKIDLAGSILWTETYHYGDWPMVAGGFSVMSDGSYVLGGTTLNPERFDTDVFLLRTEPDPMGYSGPSLPVRPHYRIALRNYPAPFNNSTTIAFTLPHPAHATLKVFDVVGREVATLLDRETQAGEHRVTFDAAGLPSGVYFCRLNAGSFSQTRKMLLMR